jgi:hypothetical protein
MTYYGSLQFYHGNLITEVRRAQPQSMLPKAPARGSGLTAASTAQQFADSWTKDEKIDRGEISERGAVFGNMRLSFHAASAIAQKPRARNFGGLGPTVLGREELEPSLKS